MYVQTKHLRLFCLLAVVATVGLCLPKANATVINFDDQGLTGPSEASGTSAGDITISTVIGNVIFSGGAILTNTSNAPADETSVYFTSDFLSGGVNPITITFPSAINNFFLNVYNGETFTGTFTVADNAGQSTTVTLASNTASGTSLISFPAAGNIVTISMSDASNFDFFIDNIGFNESTPGTNVSEPGVLGMFGVGTLLIGLFVGLRRRTG